MTISSFCFFSYLHLFVEILSPFRGSIFVLNQYFYNLEQFYRFRKIEADTLEHRWPTFFPQLFRNVNDVNQRVDNKTPVIINLLG